MNKEQYHQFLREYIVTPENIKGYKRIERFDLETDRHGMKYMEPVDDGEWVKYDEMSPMVEELEKRARYWQDVALQKSKVISDMMRGVQK